MQSKQSNGVRMSEDRFKSCQAALSQTTASMEFRTLDDIGEEARVTRLDLDKH